MTMDEMLLKLGEVGTKRSEEGDRGFMSRGAKDCTALGDMVYESIVDNRYYKVRLTTKVQLIPLENGKRVNDQIRSITNIEKGNGTVVTLEIQNHRVPLIDTIARDLSWHFALRDILDESSVTEVMIRNLNKSEKPKRIIYHMPEGDLVCDESFSVQGYSGATARLKIWRSTIILEDSGDRFRKSGLVIKGRRAIHECSLLQPSFEKDEYAKRYFGRIECDYIDTLLNDYDNKREKGEEHSIENPILLIDPNRQYGLERKHPFTKALLDVPTQKLKEFIDKDRASELKNVREITNLETKNKLNELAKAASKFLKQQIEDLEEITADEGIDNETFSKKGVLIYPTYANIGLNSIRSFGFYVNRKLFNSEGINIKLVSDSEAVELIDDSFIIDVHKKKNDLLYGKFRVKGKYLEEGICVQAKGDGLPKAEALFNVVENQIEEHVFINPIEFEYDSYKIKEGSTKTIKLFAKYPEIVNHEIEIKVVSEDNYSLCTKGRSILVPVEGSNFAYSDIIIEAKRLVNKPILLKVNLNEYTAITKVKIVQVENKGPEIKIEITDDDFGNYRATWAVREGKPNLLKVSAKHPSLKRYLGDAPDYNGQNSILFKSVLAEVVAESVCRRVLGLETEHYGWKFNWADKKEDSLILEEVFYQFSQRMRLFLPIAHSILIKENDLHI